MVLSLAGQISAHGVGGSKNLPISPDQIAQVLGSDKVQQLATAAGIDPSAMSGHLAQLLPQLINHLTPNGQVPAGGAQDILSAVAGFFNKPAG